MAVLGSNSPPPRGGGEGGYYGEEGVTETVCHYVTCQIGRGDFDINVS